MPRKSFKNPVLLALFALLGLVLVPSFASADEPTGIVAAGSGEVHARPDSVRITIGVEARAKTVQEVQREANEKLARVLASLRALGIPNLHLRTSILSVRPIHATTREGVATAQIVGYSAANEVSVAVRKAPFEKIAGHASAILNAALQSGANVAGDFELFLDDAASVREQALERAVKAARRNGEIMARAAGLEITGVALVKEEGEVLPMLRIQAPMSGAGAIGTPVEAGEILVTSNVTVRLTTR